ncbi:hypothetical protein V9T40_004605 [Parthenolecanium corni]|uniref:Major facilitator superfamily (MFS) profile domain-containing protein n=1 Tax=Parthenolecanium corni TaxID=536013 RepID=A0AAN9TV92_9HEMI
MAAAQTTAGSDKVSAVDKSGGGGGGGGAAYVKSALKEALDSMTVEPAFTVYCMVETMSKFLHQAFLLDKFAYPDWPHEPPRRDGGDGGDVSDRAVKSVALANSWLITPALFLTVFYTVLAISWSDKVGRRRRPLLLTPLCGLVLECASAALHAFFWRWPVGWLLAGYAAAQLLSGGRICFSQSVYLYVADVSTADNRTARYGVLMTVRFFAMPLGYALGGLLLRYVGFFYAFLASFAASLVALLLAWTLVVEPPPLPSADTPPPPPRRLSLWQAIRPKDSVRALRVLLKKRPQHARLILAATLLAYSLFSFTNEGELSVMYLYLSRQFRWSESQIGAYLTYRMFVNGVGTLVCSVVLSKCLKMADGSIGIFIGVAKTLAAVAYAFAFADWQLYAVPLIDMYFAAGITVTRSFATKLVASDELGRLAAVCSLTKVSVALCQPLYNTTYALTMNSAPSAFFFVSLFFAVFILLLIGYRVAQTVSQTELRDCGPRLTVVEVAPRLDAKIGSQIAPFFAPTPRPRLRIGPTLAAILFDREAVLHYRRPYILDRGILALGVGERYVALAAVSQHRRKHAWRNEYLRIGNW